jgi:hypothetical protein
MVDPEAALFSRHFLARQDLDQFELLSMFHPFFSSPLTL